MKTSEITQWNPFKTSKWHPFQEFNELQNRLNALFHRSNGDSWDGQPARAEDLDLDAWSPAVDISEDDNEFTIVADLPEVEKKDVKISMENGTMTISGEREHEEEEKNKRYHRIERQFGRYSRSFRLPQGVDEEKIDAKFDKGALTIHLPKSEEVKNQKREITIN